MALPHEGRPNCTGVYLRGGQPRTIRRAQLNDCGVCLLQAAARAIQSESLSSCATEAGCSPVPFIPAESSTRGGAG